MGIRHIMEIRGRMGDPVSEKEPPGVSGNAGTGNQTGRKQSGSHWGQCTLVYFLSPWDSISSNIRICRRIWYLKKNYLVYGEMHAKRKNGKEDIRMVYRDEIEK